MRLGWNEIRNGARRFTEEWKDAHYERGETQTFYNEFFEIFGVRRKQVAVYEQRVKLLNSRHGFIDLFWPRTLLIEQKSGRLDLRKAQGQALDYVEGLKADERPRFVLTCDFQTWNLLDLESGREIGFKLTDLPKHIEEFAFILGRRRSFGTEAAVNIKAAELMGRLHDALLASGYRGRDLERLLVQLLFCLFADDTGIFEPKDIFLQLIEEDTRDDGSDTGRLLVELFDILDTQEDQRQTGLRAELTQFPYINGALFGERVRTPLFTAATRDMLLDAARFDWGKVSPAIFGSLFQSVMAPAERRAKGAHYTSEANILKVLGPLFLDELRSELARLKTRRSGRSAALSEYQNKLARLTFFDPACGCGNFLVIAYRELRQLELDALQALYGDTHIDVGLLSRVTVGQFHGIEKEEFPARIAEVAMWMTDHLANNELSLAFNRSYARIPLKDSANIVHGDALELEWGEVLPAARCDYVLGNPPFVGAKFQTADQRAQVRRLARLGGSGGTLDYVAAWFIKAGGYVNGIPPRNGDATRRADGGGPEEAIVAEENPLHHASHGPPPRAGEDPGNRRIRIGFVATNSVTQGEQVAQLWPILFDRYGLEIAFAHRTFQWASEARGKAHVHVVIIGLAHRDAEPAEKRLFSYADIKAEPVETRHGALTAYLFDGRAVADRHLVVKEESRPINGAGRLISGSQPIDGGHYIFDASARSALLDSEPAAQDWLRRYVGAEDFINGGERWILALQDTPPDRLRAMPLVLKRVQLVRDYRKESQRASTLALASQPTRYNVEVLPTAPYLVIPEVSSERRDYIPIGWLGPPTIPSNKLRLLPEASLWDFGVLTSRMHMAWLAHVGGRLESRFQYGIGIVYNTFPWPDATAAQRGKIEALAQGVLDVRARYPTSSLADLYDPDTMPGDLRKAHGALDAAVDRLYRPAPFATDRDRVEHLFGLYEKLVAPMAREAARQNKRVARKAGAHAPGATQGAEPTP